MTRRATFCALAILGFAAAEAGCERKASTSDGPDASATVGSGLGTVAPTPVTDAGREGGALGSPKPLAPMNVLFLSIDSLRADMPWAGYERPIAPRLSALYERSAKFTRGYSTSSFTSKSIPGMLTGKYPSELVRTGAFFTKYLNGSDFFCTQLTAQEIPCIAGHAHAYFGKGQSGFESGFRDWKLVPGIAFDYQTDPYVTSDKLTTLAISMLTELAQQPEAGKKPFFAWFHYMDPHDQYQPHAESTHYGRKPRDLYDEEVFWTDLQIGKLLDFVETQPWATRTAIVVTADHGEMFGEHGMTRHAHEIWEELVHVPLFVHLPNNPPRTVDTPRGAMDLVPTFTELLGATPPTGLHGTSLVAEIRGATVAPRDVIVDLPEDEYNERRRALVHENLKLISFGKDVRYSLFDLAADPKEATDLVKTKPDLFAEMRARYQDACRNIPESPPKGGIPRHDAK